MFVFVVAVYGVVVAEFGAVVLGDGVAGSAVVLLLSLPLMLL